MKIRIFRDDVLHNLFVRFLLIMTKQAFICTKIIERCFMKSRPVFIYIPIQKKEEIKPYLLFPIIIIF